MAVASPRYPSYAAPSEPSCDDYRDSSTFRLEGFLHKLGYIRKSWKKRWFTVSLIDTRLFYYKTASASVSRGHIDLEEVTNIGPCDVPMADVCFSFSFEKGDYGFFIETPHRTYYLTAESEPDRKYWITGLKNFHRHLRSALQSVNSSVDSSCYSDARASLHISMLSSSHLQATTSVLQNIETVGMRIEKCMETITKRKSNYTPDCQRFAKARHSLCVNASIWSEIEQMSQADDEIRTVAYSNIDEASKLMVAIYGLVDDIDLMQAQIERDEIASFSKPPEECSNYAPDLNLEKRKKLLQASIENSWQQVQEKLDRLQVLATQMELLKSEVQVLPSSLPSESFLGTTAVQIPTQQETTRASYSCPPDNSFLNSGPLQLLRDSSQDSVRDSISSNSSSARTSYQITPLSSNNNFSPFSSSSSIVSPFSHTIDFATQQGSDSTSNGKTKPIYSAASIATTTINSYRDRSSVEDAAPKPHKRSHSSTTIVSSPFPGIPLKSANDPFPGIALKTDSVDQFNSLKGSVTASTTTPSSATQLHSNSAPSSTNEAELS
eukprot:TRINITY_DN1907_c0_g1_i1.p1 TRINITY_DN1907_c0_g1~~TRINITY_DN1907_c0_g1_i1.p1  ORF type:complete len:551 (-),score=107.01 TRINITY_DN1907_c0_g1_i1:316-1968(-)